MNTHTRKNPVVEPDIDGSYDSMAGAKWSQCPICGGNLSHDFAREETVLDGETFWLVWDCGDCKRTGSSMYCFSSHAVDYQEGD